MLYKYFRVFFLTLILLSFTSTLQGYHHSRPVKIGLASMITPVDTVRYYQDLIDYISLKLGVKVEMVQRKTYDEMDRLLEKGDVDAAFICSASYVKDSRDFGVELLVAPQVNGEVYYRSYLVVHKDSGLKSFDDLKGRFFAFTDPKSNTGKLYPEYILTTKGTRPQDFFSRHLYSYSHNKSIELVAKKIVDGASVDSLVYDYMIKTDSPFTKETTILEESQRFGAPPFVVSRNLHPLLKSRLQEIFKHIHVDPVGSRILKSMMIDKFIEVPDSNYDSIRAMEAFLAALKVPAVPSARTAGTINFGVLPRDNPRIAFEKYQPIVDYLSESTPYSFELILKKTYRETVEAINRRDIDVALLEPITYFEARARSGVIPILKTETEDGEHFIRTAIIAKRNGSLLSLPDLKGRSFAFASMHSTSGNLMPRYLLDEAGVHINDLSRYRNFSSHDSVVKWVLRNRFDAGSVREDIAEKYSPQGIDIIAYSEPIPTGPLVVRSEIPYEVIDKIKDTLLKMKESQKGAKVLRKLDPELRGGFIEASDSDYKEIRKMINAVPSTCGINCHPQKRL